jgi:hypothetical protein
LIEFPILFAHKKEKRTNKAMRDIIIPILIPKSLAIFLNIYLNKPLATENDFGIYESGKIFE